MNPKVKQILDNDKILKELADGLHERISRGRSEQRDFDLSAVLCRDFVMGKQWRVILDNKIIEPRRDEGEVRITANFCKKLYKAHAAEIVSNDLTWKVGAFEGDHRRIGISDVGQQVMKKYSEHFKRTQFIHRLMGGIDIDGLAYVSTDYFPNRGKPVGFLDQPDGTSKIIPSGVIDHRIISRMDVLSPDRYESREKLPWLCEIVRMHSEDVKRRWNFEKDVTPSKDQNDVQERWQATFGQENKDRDKEVEIFKFWFKAGNGLLPEEGYGVGIGMVYCDTMREVLEINPFPYPFSDYRVATYPLTDFHCDRRMDHFHSNGLLVELIPLQMQFNKMLSIMAEQGAYMGSPVWRAVRGQFSSEDDIPTYAGGVLYYNQVPGAGAPDVVQMPPLSGVVNDIANLYEMAAEKVHSINKTMQAQQEGSMNSYSANKLLKEQATKLNSDFVGRYEGGWAELGFVTLMMEAKYRDYPETLLLADDAADKAVVYFTKADLASEMVVTVDAGVSSDSPADDLQRDVQLSQIGLADKAQLQKKYYGIDQQSDFKMQSRNAYDENEAMLNGEIVDNTTIERMLGDNPEIHLSVVQEIEYEPRYQALPEQNKKAIQKHKVIHWLAKNDPQTFQTQYLVPAMTAAGYIQPMQPAGAPAPAQIPGGSPAAPAVAAQPPMQGVA